MEMGGEIFINLQLRASLLFSAKEYALVSVGRMRTQGFQAWVLEGK